MDPRHAVRALWRDRAFTLTVVFVLGLGIGVSHVFFTLVYGFKLRGLPIARADRVLHVSSIDNRGRDGGMSALEFDALRDGQRSFTGLAAFTGAAVAVGDEGRAPDRFEASYISANALGVLGVTPSIGRSFTEAEDTRGGTPVVILGAPAWRSRYGGDPSIVGRTILVNGAPATVVGVLRDKSGFPSTAAVWLPLRQMPGLALDRRDARTLRVFGRLRDGIPAADARAEIESGMAALARQFPQTNAGVRARVMTIDERLLGTMEGWVPFVIAGCLIVFVACANVANLMLARAARRAHEIAIRTSLGASRARIVRQLLMECLVLSILGGAAGLALSVAGTRAVRAMVPENVLPYWTHFSMDIRMFGALAAVSFGALLIFGLLPSVHASRTDVNLVLKSGTQRTLSRGVLRRSMSVFLAVQIALAVVLIGQVGVEMLQFDPQLATDALLEPDTIVTASVSLPAGTHKSPEQRTAFFRGLDERLRSNPAVIADVSIVSAIPGTGAPERKLALRDRPAGDATLPPSVMTVEIDPAYFRTLRVPLVSGRAFTGDDAEVAIVNQRLVELFFPQQDPIGRQIALTAPGAPAAAPSWRTIVGIAPVVRQRPTSDPLPVAYVPIHHVSPANAVVMVRAHGDPSGVAPLMRAEAQAVDAGVPLYRMQTLERAMEDAGWNGRVSRRIAASVAVLTLVLATVGLYAVIAWGVARRTREIGIRMALGARRRQIVLWVIATARAPLAAGVVLGLAGSLAWDRAFSVDRADALVPDPLVIAVVAAGVAVMTLAACAVPARRASGLDPSRALRLE